MKQEQNPIYKRLFISPHPDDIAFSAFGSLVNPPAAPQDGLVVTVFDKSSFVIGSQLHDISVGRQEEDQKFCASIGCSLITLGFRDSSLRFSMGNILGNIKPRDDPLFPKVKEALLPLVSPCIGKSPIYVPLGVGNHIDHCIATEAVRDIIRDSGCHHPESLLLFYEDLPYAASQDNFQICLTAKEVIGPKATSLLIDITDTWDMKKASMEVYSSQLEATTIRNVMEHSKHLCGGVRNAERIWYESTHKRLHIVETMAWVSWEAARFLGGYTTLLANLINTPSYQAAVGRTILIGPLYMPMDCMEYNPHESPRSIAERLGCDILYSTLGQNDSIITPILKSLRQAFQEIERRHDIEIHYLRDRDLSSHRVERILINLSACITPSNIYSRTLPGFLRRLQQKLGLALGGNSLEHSAMWDTLYMAKSWTGINPADNVLENCRKKLSSDTDPRYYSHIDNDTMYGKLLAEPATEALRAILGTRETCILIPQDTLSLPMAYEIMTNTDTSCQCIIKILYYAGDIDPVRNLITGCILPKVQLNAVGGFDWEGPMRSLITKGVQRIKMSGKPHFLDFEAFHFIHSHENLTVVQHGWKLDKVAAISENVADELVFLDEGFSKVGKIPIISPGILTVTCSTISKERARQLLLSYACVAWETVLDPNNTIIATHTARAVECKGFLRDLQLIEALGQQLHNDGIHLLLIMVTTWKKDTNPLVNTILAKAKDLNNSTTNVRVKLINQFHWPQMAEFGSRPTAMTRDDLHRATDISLGLSTYDTYAISPLEPISCGAICVISTGCGCARRLQKLTGYEENIVLADYGEHVDQELNVEQDWTRLFQITHEQKKKLEEEATQALAVKIAAKVPKNRDEREAALERGVHLAKQMDWDKEVRRSFIPILQELFDVKEIQDNESTKISDTM